MRKLRRPCLFAVLLILGFSLGLPTEDLPDTAYDESETLPYEDTSALSDVAAAAAQTSQRLMSSFRLTTAVTPLFVPTDAHDTAAKRSADVRVSLTQLTSLRC